MSAIIPKIEQLSPRIIRILGCNPGHMTLQGTNTYLVGTGEKRALIDTGEENNSEYISSLTSTLEKYKVKISNIIITHWHHDHIGGLFDVLNSTDRNATVYKFPCYEPKEEEMPSWVQLQTLKDSQEINVEGASLRVHYTPGHTQDHAVLELATGGHDCGIFTGDCILGEGTAVFEDLYDYMNSLQKLADLKPNLLYPGHGPVVTDGANKIELYINHRNKREKEIFDALKVINGTKATPSDLVKIVYKDTPETLHKAAEFNLRHHLGKLVKEGKVIAAENDLFYVSNKL